MNEVKSATRMKSSFLIKKSKADENGPAPIYMRIIIDGSRTEFSINAKINHALWGKGRPIGKSSECKRINSILSVFETKANEAYFRCLSQQLELSAPLIVSMIIGKKKIHKKTLFDACNEYVKHIAEMVGKTYATATLTRYQTTRRHVNLFMEQVYHKKDMTLDELDYNFITKFETWFRNKRKCSNVPPVFMPKLLITELRKR